MNKVKAKHFLAGWAHSLGLMQQAYTVRLYAKIFYPGTLKNNLRYWIARDKDELALPNLWARLLVAGSADIPAFIDLGRLGFESLRDTLARNDVVLDSLKDVLDFGCGCGRVLRHWRGCTARVYGTDMNEYLVEACRRTVPFAAIGRNSLEPRLDYADESFDLVYALSVFTHLDADAQKSWLREFWRILRPRGVLMLSVHGDAYQSRLGDAELADYRAGRLVVRRGDYPGGNICVAFHPPSFVFETIGRDFEILEAIPQGALGNPVQDLYMLRKAA